MDWTNAWSLEDYVFDLFENKKTESEEFKLLVRVYGREKLESLWKKYVDLKNSPMK